MGNKLSDNVPKGVYFLPNYRDPEEVFVEINRYYYPELLPYYLVSNIGRVYNIYLERLLVLTVADHKDWRENGRIVANLQFSNPITGKSYQKKIPVHRLMMTSFCPVEGCEDLEVDHLDGVYYNNFLNNLEWVTRDENMRRLMMTKTKDDYIRGEDHYYSKFTEEQAHMVCKLLESNRYTQKQIADMTNTNKVFVHNISARKNWTHVSMNYKF